jgi:hypothetical protein
LFVLATTASRALPDAERIQHLLTAYARIRQPEEWAQWVRNQVDEFDKGSLIHCQTFMNEAALKYIKISATSSGFTGSSNTLQEDIVAMVANAKRKKVSNDDRPGKPAAAAKASTAQEKPPPFAKHFKASAAADAVQYKVGDSKVHNGKTFYFCDCPNHRDKLRWHVHPADTCRTRKKWLETGTTYDASAHLADDNSTVLPETQPDVDVDVASLLAQALQLSSNNEAVHDYITDALSLL